MNQYYTCPDGKNVEGPFPWPQVLRQLKAKKLDVETLINRAGTEQWQPLHSVPEFLHRSSNIALFTCTMILFALIGISSWMWYDSHQKKQEALRKYERETDRIITRLKSITGK